MGMYKNGDVKHEEQRRDANRNESEEWMTKSRGVDDDQVDKVHEIAVTLSGA